MKKDNFNQRKKDILSKLDKSSKKSWDEKIISLCEKINSLENYYTTSSCSGRVVVMVDQEKKARNLFRFVSHDFIDFENFWKYLPKKRARLNLKFKSEPCILHVACKSLEDAQWLLDKAKLSGWKKSGIISTSGRIMVELNGTDKLEFPFMRDGEILVRNDFLKVVIERSNRNLKKSWGKIERLKRII